MQVLLLLHRFGFAFRFRTPQAQECTLSLPYLPVKFAHRFCALFLQRSGVLPIQSGSSAATKIRITFMTHCVTNPHLTTSGLIPQIHLALFFLKFCVCRNTFSNPFSQLPPAARTRHKSVNYYLCHPKSNLETCHFI